MTHLARAFNLAFELAHLAEELGILRLQERNVLQRVPCWCERRALLLRAQASRYAGRGQYRRSQTRNMQEEEVGVRVAHRGGAVEPCRFVALDLQPQRSVCLCVAVRLMVQLLELSLELLFDCLRFAHHLFLLLQLC